MAFRRGAVVGGVALLALGAWFYFGGGRTGDGPSSASRSAQATSKIPVTVAVVKKADFPIQINGLGSVQPYNTVTVRTRVDGQIEKIFVREGQLVKEGDLLLTIDPRPYQAALDGAVAKQQQDEANLENANVNLQRDSRLAKQSFASQQTIDNETATVRQLQAQIAGDKAAVFNAQTQLSYTEIKAPIGGRTSIRTVDVGNIVQAGSQAVMTIAQVQPIAVVFTAPEGQLQNIYAAMKKDAVPVSALTTDGSRVLSSGTLKVINNTVDTATGTIQLKAEFDNADNALWPGLSVDTRMLTDTLKDVVVAPDDAVEHGPNGLFAYVVDQDNKAQVRPISVGDSGSGGVVVTKGLNPGDHVVVAGQYRLQPGAEVTASMQQVATTVAEEQ